MRCVATFLHCGSLEKSIFQEFLEIVQAIGFIMLSVSKAYSASLRCVRFLANFAFCGLLEKSIFQELPDTTRTIGFIILVVSVA